MGVYLAIVRYGIQLASAIAARLQQHHDELNGAAQQQVGDQHARKEVLDALTAPVSQSESDVLWESNKAKFGPTGGPAAG